MITDCPNCSCLMEGDLMIGMNVICPFCGETFKLHSSPFEQLRDFMETHYPLSEFGAFRENGYPSKNYTGWIIHRIRENDQDSVIKLMNEFHQDLERSTRKVNQLWSFDFTLYVNADQETIDEIRALWIRARLASYARPERLNVRTIFLFALWTRKITLTQYWINKVLTLFEEERQQYDEEDPEDIELITANDLIISLPENNPLFDWAVQAPLSIRERLDYALHMCCYGSSGTDAFRYAHQFQMDDAQEYRWGSDLGYATKLLLESNIFCGPLPETYHKLFTKDEFRTFLSEYGIDSKPSYSRKRMLDMLLSSQDGVIFFKRKIEDAKIVRLQPELADYLDEIIEYDQKSYHIYDAIGMIPVPGSDIS